MAFGNGGPVIVMPQILSSSMPHYNGSSRVSPRSAVPVSTVSTPSDPTIRDKIIECINLLREMHLVVHQEIAERNYRAEREKNLSQQEKKVTPPSPSKDQIQNPLELFYKEKMQKLPEFPAKLEYRHMGVIGKLTQELSNKILQTEQEFNAKKTLRLEGLEARILNDGNGTEQTLIREDLAQFHREIPDKINGLRDQVDKILTFAGGIYS